MLKQKVKLKTLLIAIIVVVVMMIALLAGYGLRPEKSGTRASIAPQIEPAADPDFEQNLVVPDAIKTKNTSVQEQHDQQNVIVPEKLAIREWQKNAVPFHAKDGKAKIVIVFDDLGLDIKNTRRAMELPPPLTLSFMPYADNLAAQTEKARAAGHELMLHMPMQPINRHLNPGPDALLSELPDDEIRARLQKALGAFHGMVGINNHMGSGFTQNRHDMDVVMSVLKAHGLLFLDSVTIGSSQGYNAAHDAGIPALRRDVFLDNDESSSSINHQLQTLEHLARKNGYAIAIGHPHPNTIAALATWLPTLEAKGLQLVPISDLAH